MAEYREDTPRQDTLAVTGARDWLDRRLLDKVVAKAPLDTESMRFPDTRAATARQDTADMRQGDTPAVRAPLERQNLADSPAAGHSAPEGNQPLASGPPLEARRVGLTPRRNTRTPRLPDQHLRGHTSHTFARSSPIAQRRQSFQGYQQGQYR
jgi:hypothetical protein